MSRNISEYLAKGAAMSIAFITMAFVLICLLVGLLVILAECC